MDGIATVQDLRDQITRYLKRPDLAGDIDVLIRKAERRITRSLRLPIQETIAYFDLGTLGRRIPVPEKFLETKLLMNSMGTPIVIELNHLYFARPQDVEDPYPTKASRVGQNMYFWPQSSDTVTWIYYKILESVLTVPEVELLLLDVAGEAWLHAALMEGGILTRNTGFTELHRNLMNEHLSLLSELAHRDQFAGTSISAQSEYAVD